MYHLSPELEHKYLGGVGVVGELENPFSFTLVCVSFMDVYCHNTMKLRHKFVGYEV